jgi:hypothetical protein
MSYLYGDSTPSALEINYIEFLRDVMDLMVAIVQADHRARSTQEQVQGSRDRAEKDLEVLHDFSASIEHALADAGSHLDPSSPTGQCVNAVRSSSTEAIRKTANQIKSSLQSQISQLESQIKRDRASCNSSIERFLLRNDLPGTVHRLELRLENDYYRARLSGSCKDGLSFVLDLDIAPDNLFNSVVRVEQVAHDLSISLPELGGWVRKSVRQRPQKIGAKVITGLVHTANESTLKLRTGPSDDSGFDIVLGHGQVRVVFQGREASGGDPFDPDPDDADRLRSLYAEAFAAATVVGKKRSRLVEARIDGKTLADHESPGVLVQRLVARIAPTVQEIAHHSLSPSELVLKRILDDNRREEVFISKSDLMKKLDPIPLALRGIFAPLALGDLETGSVVMPRQRPTNTTMPPPPAPRAFNTGATMPPPMLPTVITSDDETTTVAVASRTATGTIKLDPAIPPPPGLRPQDQAPEKEGGDDVDAALKSLETETG